MQEQHFHHNESGKCPEKKHITISDCIPSIAIVTRPSLRLKNSRYAPFLPQGKESPYRSCLRTERLPAHSCNPGPGVITGNMRCFCIVSGGFSIREKKVSRSICTI